MALFKDLIVAEFPWDMPLDDEAAMRHTVLDCCQTAFHPCGTNRLSRSIDQGVVDPALRVARRDRPARRRRLELCLRSRIAASRIRSTRLARRGADMIKAAHKDLF
ncbi:MAG: hypothetical protein STHCBS139747_003890 [Sporothrix thermara]